jgi:hypothetical protein
MFKFLVQNPERSVATALRLWMMDAENTVLIQYLNREFSHVSCPTLITTTGVTYELEPCYATLTLFEGPDLSKCVFCGTIG